jgi:GNAT superfamily N-acetyltransferase
MPNRPDRVDLTSASRGGKEVALNGGDRVVIRPIRSEDKQDLLDGLNRLSPESRYHRFFSPMHPPERSPAPLPHRDRPTPLIRSTTDPRSAEVAIAVVDAWQGRGLGTALLEALSDRAREEGVQRFTASVLVSNSPMLDLLREIELRGPRVTPGLFQTLRAAAQATSRSIRATRHRPISYWVVG